MAKYFLGSVGMAEAFGTTKDDIRAGEGAPIQFSFYHDSSVEINLTDVLFKTEYITAHLGVDFNKNPESYITQELTFVAGKATASKKVKPLNFPCEGMEKHIVWARKAEAGNDAWFVCKAGGTDYTEITAPDETLAGQYCVRYLADDSRARVAEITSTIIPSELYLIITAPIYAGDACAASKGKAAGRITFEIPRFQLNGQQEFSMEMSSNQTMSLSGIALVSESASCDSTGGSLLRIMEVIENRKWYDDVKELVFDEEYCVQGQSVVAYGLNDKGTLVQADAADLEYREAAQTGAEYASFTDGKWPNDGEKTYSVRIKDKPAVEDTVNVRAS